MELLELPQDCLQVISEQLTNPQDLYGLRQTSSKLQFLKQRTVVTPNWKIRSSDYGYIESGRILNAEKFLSTLPYLTNLKHLEIHGLQEIINLDVSKLVNLEILITNYSVISISNNLKLRKLVSQLMPEGVADSHLESLGISNFYQKSIEIPTIRYNVIKFPTTLKRLDVKNLENYLPHTRLNELFPNLLKLTLFTNVLEFDLSGMQLRCLEHTQIVVLREDVHLVPHLGHLCTLSTLKVNYNIHKVLSSLTNLETLECERGWNNEISLTKLRSLVIHNAVELTESAISILRLNTLVLRNPRKVKMIIQPYLKILFLEDVRLFDLNTPNLNQLVLTESTVDHLISPLNLETLEFRTYRTEPRNILYQLSIFRKSKSTIKTLFIPEGTKIPSEVFRGELKFRKQRKILIKLRE
jgi:hypothetical protein